MRLIITEMFTFFFLLCVECVGLMLLFVDVFSLGHDTVTVCPKAKTLTLTKHMVFVLKTNKNDKIYLFYLFER